MRRFVPMKFTAEMLFKTALELVAKVAGFLAVLFHEPFFGTTITSIFVIPAA